MPKAVGHSPLKVLSEVTVGYQNRLVQYNLQDIARILSFSLFSYGTLGAGGIIQFF